MDDIWQNQGQEIGNLNVSFDSHLLSGALDWDINRTFTALQRGLTAFLPHCSAAQYILHLTFHIYINMYRVSQKKVSLVEFSYGKYNSSWWEIHHDFLTNPSKHLKGRFSVVFLYVILYMHCFTHFRLRASKPIYKTFFWCWHEVSGQPVWGHSDQ